MTRQLTAFTPVAGDPETLSKAFGGELFADARAVGVGVVRVRLEAMGIERDVDLHLGATWHTPSGQWRPLTWIPVEQDHDLAPVHRFLPTFVGEIGLVRGQTTLALDGVYAPPLGRTGDFVDAIALRKLAQATAKHLLTDVARRLEVAVHEPART